ncbi:MAG: hypothetical protein JWM28_933 [Chitinophagaceae bacterium]|nr:hypothetical protein [Chitinophagaceae bacterium]
MQSPVTGKPMKLVKEPGIKLSFRKEEFEITYHYYLCDDSKEQFTSDELDRINQVQVHNRYREKYGIPFPKEIKAIREKYDISASKMSEILGFGANSYRLYEGGDIPSIANGRLILAIKHPKDFIKQLEASAHILSEKELKKYTQRAEYLLEEQKKNAWDIIFSKHIFTNEKENEYSGYKKPDYTRIANMISFFSRSISPYKTKLNKLFFYCDFYYFSLTGFSMTGLTYKAITLGPVPAQFDLLYSKLCDDGLVNIELELFTNGNYGELIVGLQKFDELLFNSEELGVMKKVLEIFGPLKTNRVVELSHEEFAWIDNNEGKELISYPKYAFDLKNI